MIFCPPAEKKDHANRLIARDTASASVNGSKPTSLVCVSVVHRPVKQERTKNKRRGQATACVAHKAIDAPPCGGFRALRALHLRFAQMIGTSFFGHLGAELVLIRALHPSQQLRCEPGAPLPL